MKIQCSKGESFELTDGSEILGYLTYNGLFSSKAHAAIGNDVYEITTKGIFSSTISVTLNGKEVATLRLNWKGQIIISFHDGQEFLLKATGTFLTKYVVEDSNQQKIMLLDPDFNWAKFNYNYTITYDHKPDNILLILLATYSANYHVAAMSGVM